MEEDILLLADKVKAIGAFLYNVDYKEFSTNTRGELFDELGQILISAESEIKQVMETLIAEQEAEHAKETKRAD